MTVEELDIQIKEARRVLNRLRYQKHLATSTHEERSALAKAFAQRKGSDYFREIQKKSTASKLAKKQQPPVNPPISVQKLLDESMEYVKTLKMNEFKAKKAGTYQIASGSGGLVMIDATHWHDGEITIHDGEKLIATVASGSASVLSGIKFDSSLSLTATGNGRVGLIYYTKPETHDQERASAWL